MTDDDWCRQAKINEDMQSGTSKVRKREIIREKAKAEEDK